MVIRLNVLLLVLVVLSALALVHVRYDSRLLYSELDQQIRLTRQLETDSDTLKVAVRAQAAASRVEGFARTELQMGPTTPPTTRYVHEPAGRSARLLAQAQDNAQESTQDEGAEP